MGRSSLFTHFCICSMVFLAMLTAACSAGSTDESNTATTVNSEVHPGSNTVHTSSADPNAASMIEVKPDSPAETVITFYERLRSNKIREALHLTNLRPAIESLTDAELSEYAVDFAAVAKRVPQRIKINGETISKDQATVMLLLPNEENKEEQQTVELARSGDHWVIMAADAEAEKLIKKHGKNYFRELKIESGHEEAKKMLERLSKAQIVFAAQSGGTYADIPALINSGFLPQDITTPESTGYIYALVLSEDKKNYYATATPEKYGVSGKLSFRMVPTDKGLSTVNSRDNGGKPLSDIK